MAQAEQQSINLPDLSLPQLQQVKTQLEEEIGYLTNSYAKLKKAQATFRECKNSVEALTPKAKDSVSLIPLTTSLYVPGKLSDIDRVIVDLGTGYYAEKSTKDAIKFYNEKCTYLQGSLDKLQTTVTGKQDNLQVVVDVMNYKISLQNKAAAAEK
ncbi:subunit of tubulin prefoldin [Dimargaris cristalligena]|uniref:Prefoldin n=1 Tax=Dimargaris cristalligena TaxID=215637 RepID=A0A4P9ZQB3_9FUNG|nr:subunit of tubulin prefoldin [Dimargaris cristalligena]RKP35465.1 Prefoldin [Dimargaris cristalligena]|eukprot:RKP35465.1 Prefoldin [Dimargaris cristalligena]